MPMSNLKKKLQLATPLYWPAWLGLGLLWLIIHLPYSWQLAIGKSIGRFLYRFPTQLKHTTEVNIKLCFPELSAQEQATLVKKSFESLAIGGIEAAMSWWLPESKLQLLSQVHGIEHMESALAKGKGIILLGPHFTSLEMIGRLLGMKYAFAVMYRPHKKPFISFIHETFRKKHYANYIPRHRIRQLIRALNNNTAIWYAYDIDGGKKHSVFAPFFGVPTSSLTSVSRLVKLSDAAVIPISFFRRDNEFHYDVILDPPIENFPTGDLIKDAEILNKKLEDTIRRKPEQYVWQYKRFKTRPPGEPRLY